MSAENENKQSLFKKCGYYCSVGTRKANYYALNTAVNIYLVLLLLLSIGLVASFIWVLILAFHKYRTVELSYMLVLLLLQLLVATFHGVLLKEKTMIYCVLAMVANVLVTSFHFVLIVGIIMKNSHYVNPLTRTLPMTVIITLIYIFAFITDLNLLRFLHRKPKHWVNTKLIGPNSLHFSATEVHGNRSRRDDENDMERASEVASAEADVFGPVGEIQTPPMGTPPRQISQRSEQPRFGAGKDSSANHFENNEMENVFEEGKEEEDLELKEEMPSPASSSFEKEEDDPTQSFALGEDGFEDVPLSDDDDEPKSEYLIDVPYKLVNIELPQMVSEWQHQQQPALRRLKSDKHLRPMRYMAHFHDVSNEHRVILPDGTFVMPCPWNPYQNNNNASNENSSAKSMLRPSVSVIAEKSPLPVPEYLERADFISLLPNTKV